MFAAVGPGRDLLGLRIANLRLVILEEKSGGEWRADNADLTLSRDAD